MHKPKEPYVPDPSLKYESDDLPLNPVLRSLFVFFAFVVGSGILAAIIFAWMVPGGFKSTFQQAGMKRRLPPAPLPRLQGSVAVTQDIADLRKREEMTITSYAWIDRQKGIARVPVDRAIEIAAQQGLPDWSQPVAKQGKTK